MPQSLKSGKPPENFAGRPTNFSPKFSDGKKKSSAEKNLNDFFPAEKFTLRYPSKTFFPTSPVTILCRERILEKSAPMVRNSTAQSKQDDPSPD